MVTDGILFHDEVILLEARLRELWPVVDCFVVVEMPVTISGLPNEFVSDSKMFQERIGPFSERVKVVRLKNVPDSQDPWATTARRRMASEAVMHAAKPGLPVMLSETWRIPRKDAVIRAEENCLQAACLHHQVYWWSFWGRSKGPADKGAIFASYKVAAIEGLYSLWQKKENIRYLIDAGWTLRGFRHPAHVAAEFNAGDEPALHNLDEHAVEWLINSSQGGALDNLCWQQPTEEDVPEWTWENSVSLLEPFFEDPRHEETLQPSRAGLPERAARARNMPSQLEVSP